MKERVLSLARDLRGEIGKRGVDFEILEETLTDLGVSCLIGGEEYYLTGLGSLWRLQGSRTYLEALSIEDFLERISRDEFSLKEG